jgi:hypothetical protein
MVMQKLQAILITFFFHFISVLMNLTTVADQNCMQEEIESRLNSRNTCNHSVQSLLPSCLLSGIVKVKMYKTIILPVVLCGCETWCVTLRDEHILRVLENRLLRRIFGPNRAEVMGEWRKVHNGELHNLYSSPDIIRQMKSRTTRWVRHVARVGEEKKVNNVLVGKPKGKRPLGRLRYTWEGGIKLDLREISWEGVEWIHLAWDRDQCQAVVNTVMNPWVLALCS